MNVDTNQGINVNTQESGNVLTGVGPSPSTTGTYAQLTPTISDQRGFSTRQLYSSTVTTYKSSFMETFLIPILVIAGILLILAHIFMQRKGKLTTKVMNLYTSVVTVFIILLSVLVVHLVQQSHSLNKQVFNLSNGQDNIQAKIDDLQNSIDNLQK